MKNFIIFLITFLCAYQVLFSQNENTQKNVVEYTLTIEEAVVDITGKKVMGMTVNGGIPGPTLTFTEGDYAVIYVKNNMDVETSVHWHGLILPNFQDGVPYLTTPPILSGTTFKYEFPIVQSGTYWYHSHTMLQEQSGVYGSIVIHPKEKPFEYDKDLVLVLSDWTNEKPMDVLRTLKRGSEWYNIKKGTATPLNKVITRGGLGAQINFWRQRMEGADIADIYYAAFLTNGQTIQDYPDYKPGERVRVRFINAAASTYFWITFGGEPPLLVASDGLDVVPIPRNKTLIGIAETYDFIVTIPDNGKLEIRGTAQDGSGKTSAFLGKGEVLAATDVMRPDKIGMMMEMAKMDMKMGAPAMKAHPDKDTRYEMKAEYGMKMDMNHSKMDMTKKDMEDMNQSKMDMTKKDMEGMNQSKMDMTKKDMEGMNQSKMDMTKKDMEGMNQSKMDMTKKDMEGMNQSKMDMTKKDMEGMNHSQMDMTKKDMDMGSMKEMGMYAEFNYDYLKSPKPTDFEDSKSVKKILLNLTGNMWRYVWSMNGVPISETDKIKINKGEVTRMVLNNLTMMHHPMHLHGHFFRVLNENGEYSPLKHTVNVAPMQQVVIEFDGTEYGDWFFHCHVLYHMMSGMARVFSYDTPRDERMKGFPASKIINEGNHYYQWGMLDIASHTAELNLVSSNTRNQWNLGAEYGWNENLEAEFSYERYIQDYFRVFAGVNVENEEEGSLEELSTTAIAGIRFFTPYMFDLDIRIDNQLRPQISLGREIMIFPRTMIFGSYEYQADFGWVNDFKEDETYRDEKVWNVGLEYMLSKNVSLMGSYDNRFGGGGGLSVRF